MRYDWENQITPEIVWKMEALLPSGFSLLGVAVAKIEGADGALAEGALIANFEPDDDMWLADTMQDVMGDATAHYEAVRSKTFLHG